MSKIAIAIWGARMGYQEAEALNKEGLLDKLYTDFYVGNKPLLKRFLLFMPFKSKFITNALGRTNNNLSQNKVKSFDLLGLIYWLRRLWLKNSEEIDKLDAEKNALFNKYITRHLSEKISAVYGMNGASLEMFQWAKKKGIKCILHQVIPPKHTERTILFGNKNLRKNDIEGREKEEFALADLIFCASSFTMNSLIEEGVDPSKCRLVPYRIKLPETGFYRKLKNKEEKIKVLFAGTLNYRKGADYFLRAIDYLDLKNFEFTLAGENNLPKELTEKYNHKVNFLGRVPRKDMERVYLENDILVFPSLCEGFGFVIPEAMNFGLPVITTANTSAPDILTQEREGFIIPLKDSAAIAKCLKIIDNDREKLYRLSVNSFKQAKRFQMKDYNKKLIEEIKRIL